MTLTGIAKIDGGTGDDVLVGNGSANVFAGSGGRDTLTGGLGADTLDFNATAESTVALADLINDFLGGTDKIDLSTIDANAGVAGDQLFSFLSTGAFTNTAAQLRYDTTAISGHTMVYGDVNGDGIADFAIDLLGTMTLSSTDFFL